MNSYIPYFCKCIYISMYQPQWLLTHWGRVTHICISKPYHHWIRQWPVAWRAPSHHLNQCWYIVNWTFRIFLQWNFNQNSDIFIQENAFVSIVCEMSANLSRPQCVKLFSICKRGTGPQGMAVDRTLLMLNCFNINRHGAYGTPRSVFSNIMHR